MSLTEPPGATRHRTLAPFPPPLPDGPFTTGQARAVGVTERRLAGPGTERRTRGLHVLRVPHGGTTLDEETEVRGWMQLFPDDVALHGRSAARWWGAGIPSDGRLHVVTPRYRPRPANRAHLVSHSGSGRTQVVRGVRVTTPARTLVDLAADASRRTLLIAADHVVSSGLDTPGELIRLMDTTRRRRGILMAREIVRYASARVDSPMESVLRLLVIDDGLPVPSVNPDLFDDRGGWIGRPDLAYLDLRVAIQYEGDVHRTSQDRWRKDVERDERLMDHGWTVIRVTASDMADPYRVLSRIRTRMRSQALRLALPLPAHG